MYYLLIFIIIALAISCTWELIMIGVNIKNIIKIKILQSKGSHEYNLICDKCNTTMTIKSEKVLTQEDCVCPLCNNIMEEF